MGDDSRKTIEKTVVGLDIGTSKIAVIIGNQLVDGSVEVVGFGCKESKGLKKGVVINIDSTVQSIKGALHEAQLMAGYDIHSVYVGIAGSHIQSRNSHGVVGTTNREVTTEDIERVIETARAVTIPADQEIIHLLAQEYAIDDQEGIKDPLGMSGIRLQAKVHLVTAALNAIHNIEKCVAKCNLQVDGIILEQLASSYAVLSEDERELGVCMIDIGGGTTDIAIFTEGVIKHTAVIPIAGDQVTNDIAMALRTPKNSAEEIKVRYACALNKLVEEDHVFEVPGIGDREPQELSRQNLASVVEPRYEELFTLVLDEIRRSGYEDLIPAGIVLTGGASKMEGVTDLAEAVFHMQARLAKPVNFQGQSDAKDPRFSTSIGLLMYGLQNSDSGAYQGSHTGMVTTEAHPPPAAVHDIDSVDAGIVDRIKGWFKGNF